MGKYTREDFHYNKSTRGENLSLLNTLNPLPGVKHDQSQNAAGSFGEDLGEEAVDAAPHHFRSGFLSGSHDGTPTFAAAGIPVILALMIWQGNPWQLLLAVIATAGFVFIRRLTGERNSPEVKIRKEQN